MRPTNRILLFVCLTALMLLSAWQLLRTNNSRNLSLRQVASTVEQPLPPEPEATCAPARKAVPTRTALLPQTQAFETWVESYLAETPVRRLSLLGEGTRLANEHRAAMKQLIREDPRRALEQAIPMVTRQKLPQEIVSLLEERINSSGFFGVMGIAAEGNLGEPGIRRLAVFNEKRYQAFVYGRRAAQRTTEQMNMVGVAVDDLMAVAESPLRQLELGENPDSTKEAIEVCPVSNKTTPVERGEDGTLAAVSEDTPAVEVGPQIFFLCHGGHIQAYEDGLVAREGQSGGASKPTGPIPASYTTGPRRVLYIRATFPDQLSDPQSERDSYEMMRQTNNFFIENSFGKCYLVTTVTPLIVLPRTLDWYNFDNTDGSAYAVLNDARVAAREAGYDTNSYDLYAVRYNGPGSFGGQGYVGGPGVWLKSSSAGVAIHEFGHNLGLWHANHWNTSGRSVIGYGSNSEYGHSFDTMGAANGGNYSFNAQHRAALSWLPSGASTKVYQSGLYRIHQIDQPLLDPSKRYAISIAKDAQRTYWGEFRQTWTTNNWFMNGLQLCWGPWGDGSTDSTAYGSNGGAQLLDMTPGSPDSKTDSPLVIGKTFSDWEAGIHITPIGKGGTIPESLDVQVNIGSFPTNQAPVISSLVASSTAVATGAAVTLTVTATDGDNDPLAYVWDLADKSIAANQPSITKSWSTAGQYAVNCVVSDMKGGIATAVILVTVGSPTTQVASGTVLDSNGNPMVGVRVHNGQSGSSYRGTFTGVDGTYQLGSLATGYVLSAAFEGYTFVATGNNFTGTAQSIISLVALDDAAVEGAGAANETGTFRFTRTGSTTAAQQVRVQFSGNASSTNDYSLNPVATSNLTQSYFTIPADAASLDVVLTPTNDSTNEGPETATLNLVPATGYITSGTTSATITIADLDTPLPVVTIATLDDQANESGKPGSFVIRRTGDVTNALNVVATITGTATNGTDYPTISSPLTIPANSAERVYSILPNDDSLLEGMETAIITISTNAAYIRGATTASTIQIVDNDLPVVSVASTVPEGSESTGAPAIYTVSRTGPTTSALQVEYSLSGTAMHGTDYAVLSGTLSIPAGQSSATVTIYPINDAIGEPTQNVVLTLRNEPSYALGNSSATVTILDDDIPLIMLSVSDSDVSEAANNGTFRVFSQGSGSGSVTVNYTVTGTAASGVDFTALTGSVSVTKNNGTSNLTIIPIQDTVLEDAETVTITLTPDISATPAYILEPESSASLLINDDDQPMVSISTDDAPTISEGGTGTFYISRTGSTAAALTVNFIVSGLASAGTDFTDPGTSVVIPAGSAAVSLPITTLTDSAVEGSEEITFTLDTQLGYGARIPSATLFITDTQNASLTRQCRFTTTSSTVSETSGVVNLPVNLTSSHTAPISVSYGITASSATGGNVDYEFTPGTLVFAPGETTKTIPIRLIDDIFIEGAETVSITLRNCLGNARLSNSTYTLTITSDDITPEPYITFAGATSNATEGAGATTAAIVSLTSPQSTNISVDYAIAGGTAVEGSDFTGTTGTLVFAAGETSKTIALPLINDSVPESSETIVLTISNPLGASLGSIIQHTVNVADDDQVYVSIAATDTDISEEGPNPGTFTVTRSGNLDVAIVVDLFVSGTATSGTDYTALPATIALAIGETTAIVTATPVDDTLNDANETIIVGLTSGGTGGNQSGIGSGNYLIGASPSAQLVIQDNENAAPTITVVSPTGAAARLPAVHQGLVLKTSVADDGRPLSIGNVTLTWSKVSGPGDVTFASPTLAETDSMFSAPGDYVVRLSASDGALSAQQDFAITVEPVPWQTVNVGNASTRPGSYSEANGITTVTGAGAGTTANTTTDGHYMLYRMMSGDTEMICRVASITASDDGARCGVMIRGSSASNAQHALSAMTFNRSSFAYRRTVGGTSATANTNQAAPTTPRWVRLVRSGNSFSAYQSPDGSTWTQQGTTQSIVMADPVLVGLSVTSVSTTVSATATFDNIQIINGNTAPNVLIGTNQSTQLTSLLNLAASTGDDAKPVLPGTTTLAWTQRSGPGIASFTSASLANTDVSFSEVGTYTLRLQATDGQAITYDEVEVSVINPPTVTVSAPTNHASESGPVSQSFTITRQPVSNSPLAVQFALIGSAGNGTDYIATSTLAIIPANEASTTVLISPTADSLSEGEETITLSLSEETEYLIGAASSATIVLEDLPMDDWRTAAFGLNANDPVWSAEESDPDADGFDNLAEYAQRLVPTSPSTEGLPTLLFEGNELVIDYQENADATDLEIAPVWTDDFAQWSTQGFSETLLSNNGGLLKKRATLLAPSNAARKFVKIRFLRPLP